MSVWGGRDHSLSPPDVQPGMWQKCFGLELKSASQGQAGHTAAGLLWSVGGRDIPGGTGRGPAWPPTAQPGLNWWSDSWASSDPPYLVLRCLTFLIFPKKINLMKIEIIC